MTKTFWFAAVLMCVTLSAGQVSAGQVSAGQVSAEVHHQWTVVLNNGSATLQTTPEVKAKHLVATITALQENGVEKFTLATREAGEQNRADDKAWFSVRFHEDTAEISAAYTLPLNHLTGLIKQLGKLGVKKIKLSAPVKPTARPDQP